MLEEPAFGADEVVVEEGGATALPFPFPFPFPLPLPLPRRGEMGSFVRLLLLLVEPVEGSLGRRL